MAQTEGEQRIATVRRFNRFYTKQIGLLGEGYLATPFSLTEARVLSDLDRVRVRSRRRSKPWRIRLR